ncbi:conserved hypothetical protein [Ricinus communis]|uniref:Uncharacterized protein n=1 Tax=Ricinus communis TaxID=3988 RepID=B9T9V0_RICCO|nr:conserved hypothetical protein [Ricinus communis]
MELQEVAPEVFWCSHCLRYCRVEYSGNFKCCPQCGKVLGEITCCKLRRIQRANGSARIDDDASDDLHI